MSVDFCRLIPGYGIYKSIAESNPYRVMSYESRKVSEHSQAIKDIIKRVLTNAYCSNHPEISHTVELMISEVSKQAFQKHSATRKEQLVSKLVDKKFKIIEAFPGEGEIFSVSIAAVGLEVVKSEMIQGRNSYIIGIGPQIDKDELNYLVIREIGYIVCHDPSIQEGVRGIASITASIVACYFGFPSLLMLSCLPAALVADYAVNIYASNYGKNLVEGDGGFIENYEPKQSEA